METATALELTTPRVEPKLIEIADGMYTFGDISLVEGSGLVIAVHPYFNGYDGDRYWDDYMPKFEAIVTDHKGILLTLEEHYKVKDVAERYHELGRHNNSVFVSTDEEDPRPYSNDMIWDDVLDFIESLKNVNGHELYNEERPVKLVGGFYFPEYGGCVGRSKRKLKDRSIPTHVIRDTTFV
jgi:hypothetical protein